MSSLSRTVALAGLSTRALAESAARAGFRVVACDAFADIDLQRCARVLPLPGGAGQGYTARDAALALGAITASYAAYTSNYENEPEAVRLLAWRRILLGNPPSVLRAVRDPFRLRRFLRRSGFPAPVVRASAPATGRDWVRKPRRSGGGRRVVRWRRGMLVPRATYLQEHIAGTPCSIVFAADGRRTVPFGWSRQLVGERRLGARGFRYAGSILIRPRDRLVPRGEAAHERAIALAEAITSRFRLVGVNGIDFVVRRGIPFPVEVNPRYSASMELVERACGCSVFQLHLDASRGRLGEVPPGRFVTRQAMGKAIVYARQALTLGDTRPWLADPSVGDIPHAGARIGRGHPICTVFASGRSGAACRTALFRRAARLYRELAAMKRSLV